MRHYITGLSKADPTPEQGMPDGVFLVRVERAQHRWHAQKPYYSVLFLILDPKETRGRRFNARLYATAKALWKLNWFLRDFGYDSELLERDEIDEKHLVGLSGVVKTRRAVIDGTSVLGLDGFAPSSQWQEQFRGQWDQVTGTGAGS